MQIELGLRQPLTPSLPPGSRERGNACTHLCRRAVRGAELRAPTTSAPSAPSTGRRFSHTPAAPSARRACLSSAGLSSAGQNGASQGAVLARQCAAALERRGLTHAERVAGSGAEGGGCRCAESQPGAPGPAQPAGTGAPEHCYRRSTPYPNPYPDPNLTRCGRWCRIIATAAARLARSPTSYATQRARTSLDQQTGSQAGLLLTRASLALDRRSHCCARSPAWRLG